MFKVASLNGNGANQTLLSMNNLVEGNIHGGIIDNTTGTKQNVTFIVGTVKFPLSVDANGTTPVSKINVPSDTTVQVNAPIGVNVSISYIETAADASAALTTIQWLVSEADTSATNAGISETNANNSAINANLSAENANESETNASNSEIMANKWAVNPENTEVLTGQFSAYHWARKAQAVASGDVIDDTEINDLLTWSSTKINSLDVANVKLSGDQTIEDVKTFISSPIVPTPTLGSHAVNKDYVKNNSDIGAITSYSQISGTNTIEGIELTNNIHDVFGDGSAVATYQLNGNANDLGGKYNSTATLNYVDAKFGQGTNSAGVSLGFNIGTLASWTVSFFVKANLSSNYNSVLLFKSGNETIRKQIYFRTIDTGMYGLMLYDEGSNIASKITLGTSVYSDNNGIVFKSNVERDLNFHHIVATYNNGTFEYYIDNILTGKIENAGAWNLEVGAGNNWIQNYNIIEVILDQVRIFNRALTASEINTLYSESIVSANATFNINQGIFIYPKGLTSRGYAKSSDTFTGTVPTSGVSDGWKYVAKDEKNNFSFYGTKPTLGKTSAELYLKDGKLYKSSDDTEITPISFLSNKVRFASGFAQELAPSGIAKIVTDSFETAGFDLGQTWQDVTAIRAAGVTYTNNTGKAIEVLINIIGNNTTFTIDTLTTNTVANNGDYTTITATIPVGSTYKISSGIQKWFELI